MPKLKLCATLLALVLSGESVSLAKTPDSPPRNAAPVGAAKLRALYADRTWTWKSGAGYFGPHGKFEAWADNKDGKTYGIGSWNVRSGGRVCFRAVWHYSGGSKDATHCFKHVKAKGTIYQRAEPGRAWAVFSAPKADPGEEYAKFEKGNHVSGQLDAMRSALKKQ